LKADVHISPSSLSEASKKDKRGKPVRLTVPSVAPKKKAIMTRSQLLQQKKDNGRRKEEKTILASTFGGTDVDTSSPSPEASNVVGKSLIGHVTTSKQKETKLESNMISIPNVPSSGATLASSRIRRAVLPGYSGEGTLKPVQPRQSSALGKSTSAPSFSPSLSLDRLVDVRVVMQRQSESANGVGRSSLRTGTGSKIVISLTGPLSVVSLFETWPIYYFAKRMPHDFMARWKRSGGDGIVSPMTNNFSSSSSPPSNGSDSSSFGHPGFFVIIGEMPDASYELNFSFSDGRSFFGSIAGAPLVEKWKPEDASLDDFGFGSKLDNRGEKETKSPNPIQKPFSSSSSLGPDQMYKVTLTARIYSANSTVINFGGRKNNLKFTVRIFQYAAHGMMLVGSGGGGRSFAKDSEETFSPSSSFSSQHEVQHSPSFAPSPSFISPPSPPRSPSVAATMMSMGSNCTLVSKVEASTLFALHSQKGSHKKSFSSSFSSNSRLSSSSSSSSSPYSLRRLTSSIQIGTSSKSGTSPNGNKTQSSAAAGKRSSFSSVSDQHHPSSLGEIKRITRSTAPLFALPSPSPSPSPSSYPSNKPRHDSFNNASETTTSDSHDYKAPTPAPTIATSIIPTTKVMKNHKKRS
jgi:hypothetical protein